MNYLCKFELFDCGVNTWAHIQDNWPYEYFKIKKLAFEEDRDYHKPHKVYSDKLLNLDNLIDIVTETAPQLNSVGIVSDRNDFMFHTEKTFRSILFGKPFLVLGNKGQNKNLQKFGITLYESIFDYHFDDTDSLAFRCIGIIDNLFAVKNKNYNKIRDSVIEVSISNIDTLTDITYNDSHIPDKLKLLIDENKEAYRIMLKSFDVGYCEAFGIDYNWRLTDNIFRNIY